MSVKAEKGREYFSQGLNCAQAVFLAFKDDFNLSEQFAKDISAGFGAGMGGLREVCGVVSAAFMVLGLKYGGKVTKAQMYKIEQEFAARFIKDNGSIICRDLLGLGNGEKTASAPSERNEEYYKKRPCKELVAYSIEVLESLL